MEGVTGKTINLGQFWTAALKNTHLFSVWMKMRTGLFLFFFGKHLGALDICFRDLAVHPVAKIPHLQYRGRWYDLVGEVRSHISCPLWPEKQINRLTLQSYKVGHFNMCVCVCVCVSKPGSCNNLEVWEGLGVGKEVQVGGNMHMCMPAKLLSPVQLFGTPWTIALRVLLSMGLSRQEHWSQLP